MVDKEKEVDYLPIIRAVMKMSSALNDSDAVIDSKYYKFKFKVRLREWVEVFEKVSKPLMGQFMKDSESALTDAYCTFESHSDGLLIKSPEKTSLILFYCKLKSGMNDLKDFPFEDGGMMTFLLQKFSSRVLKEIESQYPDILSIKDSDGETIEIIVDNYDELGNTMFVKK